MEVKIWHPTNNITQTKGGITQTKGDNIIPLSWQFDTCLMTNFCKRTIDCLMGLFAICMRLSAHLVLSIRKKGFVFKTTFFIDL